MAELVHDALIRDWDALRDWVSQDHRFQDCAHLRGAPDGAIAHQTRHRSLATLGRYVRVQQQAWTDQPPPPSSGCDARRDSVRAAAL